MEKTKQTIMKKFLTIESILSNLEDKEWVRMVCKFEGLPNVLAFIDFLHPEATWEDFKRRGTGIRYDINPFLKMHKMHCSIEFDKGGEQTTVCKVISQKELQPFDNLTQEETYVLIKNFIENE